MYPRLRIYSHNRLSDDWYYDLLDSSADVQYISDTVLKKRAHPLIIGEPKLQRGGFVFRKKGKRIEEELLSFVVSKKKEQDKISLFTPPGCADIAHFVDDFSRNNGTYVDPSLKKLLKSKDKKLIINTPFLDILSMYSFSDQTAIASSLLKPLHFYNALEIIEFTQGTPTYIIDVVNKSPSYDALHSLQEYVAAFDQENCLVCVTDKDASGKVFTTVDTFDLPLHNMYLEQRLNSNSPTK